MLGSPGPAPSICIDEVVWRDRAAVDSSEDFVVDLGYVAVKNNSTVFEAEERSPRVASKVGEVEVSDCLLYTSDCYEEEER